MLGARPQSGIELVLDTIGFKEMVAGCDLVVTGEGRVDSQTLMGKAPSGVLRYAQTQGVPCIAVGGGVVWSEELRRGGFKNIYAATPHDMPLEEAMRSETAYANLRATAVRIAQEMNATR
jgi:glycerate kinase